MLTKDELEGIKSNSTEKDGLIFRGDLWKIIDSHLEALDKIAERTTQLREALDRIEELEMSQSHLCKQRDILLERPTQEQLALAVEALEKAYELLLHSKGRREEDDVNKAFNIIEDMLVFVENEARQTLQEIGGGDDSN